MRRSSLAIMILLAALFGFFGRSVLEATVIRAQSGDCGDPRDLPIHFLICSWRNSEARNDRQDTRLDEQDVTIAQLRTRIAALEADPPGLTEVEAGEIAWNKAGDRIFAWEQDNLAYRNRFLYDTIYRRFCTHARRNALPVPNCPAAFK